jgi:hypothetical protein
MMKSQAVVAAIAGWLHHDNHWPPNNMNMVMGADYNYTETTLAIFLASVRDSLKKGNPSYTFSFDNTFTKAQLGSSVAVLIGSVDAKTK